MRICLNFIILNCLVFLPVVYCVSGFVPDKILVDVIAEDGGTISMMYRGDTIHTRRLEKSERVQTCAFYIPKDYDYEGLSFDVERCGTETVEVKDRRLEKMRCVLFHSSGSWSLTKRGTLFLLLVELMLVVLAAVSSVFKSKSNKKVDVWALCFVVALMFSFALGFAFYYQSYKINSMMFEIDESKLIYELGVRFLLMLVLSWFSFVVLVWFFGRFPIVVVMSLVLGFYLESGVLSIGLGELNGNVSILMNSWRSLCDLVVWLVVLVVFFGCACRIRDESKWRVFVYWTSASISVLILASVLDVVVGREDKCNSGTIREFCSFEDAVDNVRFSTKGNVFLLVLDSISREEAHVAITDSVEGGELREMYQGFVSFTNNIGMHAYTKAGMAGALTGKYLNSRNTDAYYRSIFSKDSVIYDAMRKCSGVYVMFGSYPLAFCNPQGGGREDAGGLEVRSGEQQRWNLKEVVGFRLLPLCLKSRYYSLLFCGWPPPLKIKQERYLYNIVGKSPCVDSNKKSFISFHTYGSHIPICFNRHGDNIPGDETFAGASDAAIFVLKQVGLFFDDLRRRGLYDSSTIIVMADHSGHYMEDPQISANGLLQGGRPMLWVKPPCSRGAFSESEVSTSHANICALLKKAIVKDLTLADVKNTLRSTKRLFRLDLNGRRLDRIVNAKGEIEVEEGEF